MKNQAEEIEQLMKEKKQFWQEGIKNKLKASGLKRKLEAEEQKVSSLKRKLQRREKLMFELCSEEPRQTKNQVFLFSDSDSD